MGTLYITPDSAPESLNGYSPITEGRYHCIVVDVQSSLTRTGKPYDRLRLQILAGEQPGQEGKMLTQALFYNEERGRYVESDAHTRWAWAAGLLHPGVQLNFTPRMLSGRQVIATIVRQRDGTYSEVGDRGYAVWPVGHRDVAGVPLGQVNSPADYDDF